MLPNISHSITTCSVAAEPVLFRETAARTTSLSHERQKCCLVCHTNQARYSCPKCHVPYCSVKCYHDHTSQQNDAASSCTESFYQGRVSQVLELEAKGKKDDMMQILRRTHERDKEDHEAPVGCLDHPSSCTENRLSQDELVHLLSSLEDCHDDATKLELLLTSLPSRVRKAVNGIVRHSGELSGLQEWILEPWHPWWRIELVRHASDEEESDDDCTPTEEKESPILK